MSDSLNEKFNALNRPQSEEFKKFVEDCVESSERLTEDLKIYNAALEKYKNLDENMPLGEFRGAVNTLKEAHKAFEEAFKHEMSILQTEGPAAEHQCIGRDAKELAHEAWTSSGIFEVPKLPGELR